MTRIRLFIPVVILALTACKKHTNIVTCTNANIELRGIGFPFSDSMAVVQRYTQDNAFDSLIDSAVFLHFSFDTVYWTVLQPITLAPGNDYTVILKGTNNVYRFSRIKNGSHFHESMAAGTGSTCTNPIISYALNDSTVNVADTTKTHGPLRINIYR